LRHFFSARDGSPYVRSRSFYFPPTPFLGLYSESVTIPRLLSPADKFRPQGQAFSPCSLRRVNPCWLTRRLPSYAPKRRIFSSWAFFLEWSPSISLPGAWTSLGQKRLSLRRGRSGFFSEILFFFRGRIVSAWVYLSSAPAPPVQW